MHGCWSIASVPAGTMSTVDTMNAMRTESDALGTMQIPSAALYGIHTARAIENFRMSGRPLPPSLVHAYGCVKEACLQAAHEQTPWPSDQIAALLQACREMATGALDAHIRVDALQGGAGTSTNMNVNEVITNRALQLLGLPLGSSKCLDPLRDANRYQSTNDTYPTALRIAAIRLSRELADALTALQRAFETKEHEWADVVKVGRTQFQDAVLTTAGRSMGAYAEALARDRWRIYKCEERLRVVNLGGTAIGTGLGAPRQYIFRATEVLRSITGIGLARAENLLEATQHADVFVEVSGILKACATNLIKLCSDLRFLSSGPDAGIQELSLPAVQAGSSIMPGKVNPVIPEAVTQAGFRVMANDQLIAQAAASGCLELNPFLPVLADALLESLLLLTQACKLLNERCILGMQINRAVCARYVGTSTATATALASVLGYATAAALLEQARSSARPLRELVTEQALMTNEAFDWLTSPEAVTRLGSDPTQEPSHATHP